MNTPINNDIFKKFKIEKKINKIKQKKSWKFLNLNYYKFSDCEYSGKSDAINRDTYLDTFKLDFKSSVNNMQYKKYEKIIANKWWNL